MEGSLDLNGLDSHLRYTPSSCDETDETGLVPETDETGLVPETDETGLVPEPSSRETDNNQ